MKNDDFFVSKQNKSSIYLQIKKILNFDINLYFKNKFYYIINIFELLGGDKYQEKSIQPMSKTFKSYPS